MLIVCIVFNNSKYKFSIQIHFFNSSNITTIASVSKEQYFSKETFTKVSSKDRAFG